MDCECNKASLLAWLCFGVINKFSIIHLYSFFFFFIYTCTVTDHRKSALRGSFLTTNLLLRKVSIRHIFSIIV